MGYKFEFGSYYFYDPHTKQMVAMMDQVAIVACVATPALLQHGEAQRMLRWWKENRPRYKDLFPDVQVLTFPVGYPAEGINEVIDAGVSGVGITKLLADTTMVPLLGPGT